MSELKILGRVIGTYEGWDGEPGDNIWFYDFIPAKGINIPECDCLYFEEIEGYIKCGTAIEEITNTYDVIELLKDVPRS